MNDKPKEKQFFFHAQPEELTFESWKEWQSAICRDLGVKETMTDDELRIAYETYKAKYDELKNK